MTNSVADPQADQGVDLGPLNKSSSAVDTTGDDAEIPEGKIALLAVLMALCASIGGLIFGYESGQVSGFLQMPDFINRFGNDNGGFEPVRAGTIVGILCAGTLLGCLLSGWLCEKIGRRLTISLSSSIYMLGVTIEVSSNKHWAQFAVGRLVSGCGIGILSISVPLYQSESIPKRIRAAAVCSFQLMITLGILLACVINYTTESAFTNSSQWRLPSGLSAMGPSILTFGILFLPESPRFTYRNGKKEKAREVMGRLNGVPPDSRLVNAEIAEIERQLQIESAQRNMRFYEIFTGRRWRRTLLGASLQAGQQLTGINFFFYYGTTVFRSTGISNSFVTAIILASVNVAATAAGMLFVEKVGRRKMLIGGAVWMSACLFGYTFVGRFALNDDNPGSTPIAGNILIVFTCLFICAFAVSWGPLVWVVVSELYPPHYRASAMALATGSNWMLNFIISFTSPFIMPKAGYFYGLGFAVACVVMAVITYFCVCETKGRSLEEVNQMYDLGVNPRESADWKPEVPAHAAEVDQDVQPRV